MTDDLVTRLDALHIQATQERITPQVSRERLARALIDAWPEVRDRLTAAEQQRDLAEKRGLAVAEAAQATIDTLTERLTAAEAERDEAHTLIVGLLDRFDDDDVLTRRAEDLLARLRDRSTR